MQNQQTNKAIIYIRISTPNQKEGAGLELQQQACELEIMLLCQRFNIEITEVLIFSDVISGSTNVTAREGLCKALKSLPGARFFIVYDIDRLARKKNEHLPRIMSMISKAGVELVVVKENEEKETQSFASEQKLITSHNAAVNTVKEKKKRKERTGNIPYGYCKAENPKFIKKDKKEQRILKKIERDWLQGKSANQTAEELNIKGNRKRGKNCTVFTEDDIYKKRKMVANKPLSKTLDITRTDQVTAAKRISGNAPWGFEIVNNEYVENSKEQELVNLFVELRALGLSYEKMTIIANKRGHKNREDNPIQLTQTKRIMKRLNF